MSDVEQLAQNRFQYVPRRLFSGNGAPASLSGGITSIQGDIYIDEDSGSFYESDGTNWVLKFSGGGEIAAGVKVYRALLSQTGTAAPVVTVLENTFASAIVWTRSEEGIYFGTLSSAFTENKTLVFVNGAIGTNRIIASRTSSNVIQIESFGNDTGYIDNILLGTSIEIVVYP